MAIDVLTNKVPPVPPQKPDGTWDPQVMARWLLIVQQQSVQQALAIKELQVAVGI